MPIVFLSLLIALSVFDRCNGSCACYIVRFALCACVTFGIWLHVFFQFNSICLSVSMVIRLYASCTRYTVDVSLLSIWLAVYRMCTEFAYRHFNSFTFRWLVFTIFIRAEIEMLTVFFIFYWRKVGKNVGVIEDVGKNDKFKVFFQILRWCMSDLLKKENKITFCLTKIKKSLNEARNEFQIQVSIGFFQYLKVFCQFTTAWSVLNKIRLKRCLISAILHNFRKNRTEMELFGTKEPSECILLTLHWTSKPYKCSYSFQVH